MNYKKYQNARDAAWKLLLDCGIKELPVPISGIARELGIRIKYCHGSPLQSGYIIPLSKPAIFVNGSDPKERQRFTVAHELGHLLLGHTKKDGLLCRIAGESDEQEQAANVFAARILAPACVLWGCNAQTQEEIARLCNISLQAAAVRAERMTLLRTRGRFLSSPLEREVYCALSEFIANHKIR